MPKLIRSLAFCTLLTLYPLAVAQSPAAENSPAAPAPAAGHLNVLLITADDLNYDSLGVTGCRIPGITPNIDRLAAEGVRFTHAHVTVAVCQPSRSALMTGRYPYRNGAMGFEPIREDVPTLQESLRAAGYMNGIFAKVGHLAPRPKFCWDIVVDAAELAQGRDPQLYYENAKSFFEKAKAAGKPFFLMANSQDPHRPFAGTEQNRPAAARRRGAGQSTQPAAFTTYSPAEIPVPGFLPDLPQVRTDLAQYFASVHRCDETVGRILQALDETGFRDNTIVMFLSDNGMSFPFSKTNCYVFSTQTPWIVRWPGKVRPRSVDDHHFISGIDFMPTILDALGLPEVKGMDGRSFLPLLTGREQVGREVVHTVFHQTAGKNDYPMRAVHTRRFSYIFNAWSDGQRVFRNEAQGGLAFKGMQAAVDKDAKVAERVHFFLHRVPEELYNLEKDPFSLKNLINDPQYNEELGRLRSEMLKTMQATGDPLLETFKKQIAPKTP